jgi:hypothetical protein
MRLQSLHGRETAAERGDESDASDDGEWETTARAAGGGREEATTRFGLPIDRGQSNVIGAAVMAAILALLFVQAQTTWAPQVRQNTEFDHARGLLSEMSQVQANTISSAQTGAEEATVVDLGGSYPTYLILIQPPGPSGAIRTGETQTVRIRGFGATDPEIDDLYTGAVVSDPATFQSDVLRYEPNYINYQDAPDTVIQHNVLYEDYSGSDALTDSTVEVNSIADIVDGNRIQLVAQHNDLSRSQSRPITLEQEPLSGGGDPVRVTDNGDHIRLRFESSLPLAEWRRMLASEIDSDTSAGSDSDGDGRYVAEVERSGDDIIIHLEGDAQYLLDAAKVGQRASYQAPIPEDQDPEAAYIDLETNPNPSVQEGGSTVIQVSVADKYHNPVASEGVTAANTRPTFSPLDSTFKQTPADGTVQFRYEAPEDVSSDTTDTVEITIGGGTQPAERVTVDVEIQDTG